MNPRDTHCSRCGAAYPPPLAYPRRCPACGAEAYANPIPVAVVLLPVLDGGRAGLLVIRRAIPPGLGKLALIGGFLEEHETWQAGAAREVHEETGVVIDPAGLAPVHFTSTRPNPNRVLLFARAAPVARAALPPFVGDHETSARGLVFGPGGLDEAFAFDLHAEAARRHFAEAGVTGPHAFEPC